jgi:ketose-bisphosphate aldolase
MKNEYLKLYKTAKTQGYALGAFNVFNLITAQAVMQAAEELDTPVVIEMSMSVIKKMGVKKATKMLNVATFDAKVPFIIHLDHCSELSIAKECIDEGWKSIMYDGSKLSMKENTKNTKEIVDYAKGKNVLVEGEVGVILGTEDEHVSDISKLAKLEETLEYIKKTSIDMIAPAIGTAHGLYMGKPIINYKLIKELADIDICPVVIHGGTGLSEAEYKKLVTARAAKINVSTALKYAYLDTMAKLLKDRPIEYNPIKYDYEIIDGVKEVIKEHIKYFRLS